MVKIKVSMTVSKDVLNAFKEYCNKNGMKVSTKVEQMMREKTKNIPLNEFSKEQHY